MPFDGLPEGLVSDMVKLRIALDGVRRAWDTGALGGREDDAHHCALGWLLVATDWDPTEATRLALNYVYPALPQKVRKADARLQSIYEYNDNGGHKRIVRLFDEAVRLAERRVVL